MREYPCEIAPVFPRQLRESRRDRCRSCRRVSDLHLLAGRGQKREGQRRRQSRQKCPAKHAAKTQHSQQSRSAERPKDSAERVHRTFESERAARLVRRDALRQQRIARRPAAAASHPSKRAQHQHGRPTLRKRITECGNRRRDISCDPCGPSPSGTICDESARQFRKTREAIGNAFDHSQRDCRRAKAREECGQNRGRSLVSPIGEKARETDAEHAARKPALRRRRWGASFAHDDRPAVL